MPLPQPADRDRRTLAKITRKHGPQGVVRLLAGVFNDEAGDAETQAKNLKSMATKLKGLADE